MTKSVNGIFKQRYDDYLLDFIYVCTVIDFKCSNEEEKLINVATDNYETNNLTIL